MSNPRSLHRLIVTLDSPQQFHVAKQIGVEKLVAPAPFLPHVVPLRVPPLAATEVFPWRARVCASQDRKEYSAGTNGPSENLLCEAVIQGKFVADIEHCQLVTVAKLGSVLIRLLSRRISNVEVLYKEYHCATF